MPLRRTGIIRHFVLVTAIGQKAIAENEAAGKPNVLIHQFKCVAESAVENYPNQKMCFHDKVRRCFSQMFRKFLA